MEQDYSAVDIEAIKQELIHESKQCQYPMTKHAIKFRYRNIAYDLYTVSIYLLLDLVVSILSLKPEYFAIVNH